MIKFAYLTIALLAIVGGVRETLAQECVCDGAHLNGDVVRLTSDLAPELPIGTLGIAVGGSSTTTGGPSVLVQISDFVGTNGAGELECPAGDKATNDHVYVQCANLENLAPAEVPEGFGQFIASILTVIGGVKSFIESTRSIPLIGAIAGQVIDLLITTVETVVNVAVGNFVLLAWNLSIGLIASVPFTVPGCQPSTIGQIEFCGRYGKEYFDIFNMDGNKFNLTLELETLIGLGSLRVVEFSPTLDIEEDRISFYYSSQMNGLTPYFNVEIEGGGFDTTTEIGIEIGDLEVVGGLTLDLECNDAETYTIFFLKFDAIEFSWTNFMNASEAIRIAEETIGQPINENLATNITVIWEAFEEMVWNNATGLFEMLAGDRVLDGNIPIYATPPCFSNFESAGSIGEVL